jgi:hypothetical protein
MICPPVQPCADAENGEQQNPNGDKIRRRKRIFRVIAECHGHHDQTQNQSHRRTGDQNLRPGSGNGRRHQVLTLPITWQEERIHTENQRIVVMVIRAMTKAATGLTGIRKPITTNSGRVDRISATVPAI